MNCPAKTEPIVPDGHNQSPNELSSDLTTRSDLGRVANARFQREHRLSDPQEPVDPAIIAQPPLAEPHEKVKGRSGDCAESREEQEKNESRSENNVQRTVNQAQDPHTPVWRRWSLNVSRVLRTYTKFIGPGFMVAVVSFNLR